MRFIIIILLALLFSYCAASSASYSSSPGTDRMAVVTSTTTATTLAKESEEEAQVLRRGRRRYVGRGRRVYRPVYKPAPRSSFYSTKNMEYKNGNLVFQSTLAPRSMNAPARVSCVTHCEWFSSNKARCSRCKRPFITYDPKELGSHNCPNLLADFKSGKIRVALVNRIKRMCKKQGKCKCTKRKVTSTRNMRLQNVVIVQIVKLVVQEFETTINNNINMIKKSSFTLYDKICRGGRFQGILRDLKALAKNIIREENAKAQIAFEKASKLSDARRDAFIAHYIRQVKMRVNRKTAMLRSELRYLTNVCSVYARYSIVNDRN
jgi:hypothetical protein